MKLALPGWKWKVAVTSMSQARKSHNDTRLSAYYMLEKHLVLYLSYKALKQFCVAGFIFPISQRMKLRLKEAESPNNIQHVSVRAKTNLVEMLKKNHVP